MLYLSIIILGTLAGLLGGAFGLAGTVILVPGLVLMNVVPNYSVAVGTVLFSMLPPTTLLAVLEYHKRKQVNYSIGIVLLITTTIATYIGAYFNKFMSEQIVKYVASLCLFILSIGLFYSGYIDDGGGGKK